MQFRINTFWVANCDNLWQTFLWLSRGRVLLKQSPMAAFSSNWTSYSCQTGHQSLTAFRHRRRVGGGSILTPSLVWNIFWITVHPPNFTPIDEKARTHPNFNSLIVLLIFSGKGQEILSPSAITYWISLSTGVQTRVCGVFHSHSTANQHLTLAISISSSSFRFQRPSTNWLLWAFSYLDVPQDNWSTTTTT